MGITKKTKFNSMLYALLLNVTVVCNILAYFIDIPNSSALVSLGLFLIICITNTTYKREQFIKNIYCFAAGLMLFLFSVLMGNKFSDFGQYFIFYIVFFGTSIFANQMDFDFDEIVKVLLYIAIIDMLCFIIFESYEYINKLEANYWQRQMQISYVQLRNLIVCIYALAANKISKRMKKVTIGIFVFDLMFIMVFAGSRGPLVCLAIFVLALYIQKEKHIKKVVFLVTISLILIVVFMNLESVLLGIYNFLSSIGITIGSLNKTIYLLQTQGSFDNGRNELVEMAVTFIERSPIIGNGIGYFEANVDGYYVHSLIYQCLCEFGCVGLIILIAILYKSIKSIFVDVFDETTKKMDLFMFMLAIPHLIFSSSYWLSTYFWMYMGWIINRKYFIKKQRKIRIEGEKNEISS